MTAHVPGQSLDFDPVASWYGGSTGALTHVHIDVVPDRAAAMKSYESGVYSLIGYAQSTPGSADLIRYRTDPQLTAQLTLVPSGTTFWIGFNLRTGPFAGDPGKAGRHAFSTAIDRTKLVDALCSNGTLCKAATGGVISEGLGGYLGDGADTNAKFDPKAAKAEYLAWDPNGSKVKNLTYEFDTDPFNQAVCNNLAAQWQANLGVAVTCDSMDDRKAFFDTRNSQCGFSLFRNSWSADYDHPQNWFDYLFVSGAPSSGSCYSNSNFDKLVRGADAKPMADALADYQQAGQQLVTDVAYGALVYSVQPYLAHAYVQGTGGNALYDFAWTEAKIFNH
jgi:ABC-type oligopeptide transport system substrate-binding subunit